VNVDAQIDALYQLPPDEFTAARNALAKSLAGEEARSVKKLQKPTIVPWTVNQLFWRARKTYDRLLKSGAALRAAQLATLEGSKADVARRSDEHRQAVDEAVQEAMRLAAAASASPSSDQLARMLEALSLASRPPGHPGRFTELAQPAGFEALAGLGPGVGAPAPPTKPTPAEQKRAKEAAARREQTEAAVKAAEEELARARERETFARADLERAESSFERVREARRTAEEELAAARRKLKDL
jgi:hypothetical protein